MNLTGRPIYQKTGKAAKKPRKRMRPFSPKKAKQRASEAGKAALEHMAQVKLLPCVVCGKPGPSDVHHCIHGRYSARRASDFETIPLCVECHRYPYPLAIHSGKQSWLQRNGPDYEFLPVVAEMLGD